MVWSHDFPPYTLQLHSADSAAFMIHRHVFHNHRLLPLEEVRLSPGQAGLFNGWGLFTTVHITRGEPFAFERHWRRLTHDAERTHCPLPSDEATVLHEVRELARINHAPECAARIYVIYNGAGMWRSDEHFPEADLLVYTAALPHYNEPSQLALREHGRHAASPLAGVKVTSWLLNAWCLQEALQQGYDEVVLLNERGEVAECTAANIFCVKDARIFTPPLSSGCLEGVTRSVLLEIAPEAGYSAEERILYPADLFGADEVFLSSTNRNLLAVSEIAGRRVASGPAVKKLEKAFESYVEGYVASRISARTSNV
jgi:branched-chain amino acid aminotransferase